MTHTYNANNGKLNTLTYGNGKVVQCIYDHLDRISEMCYNFKQGIVRVHQLGANPNMVKWSADNPSCNYNSNIIYYAVTK